MKMAIALMSAVQKLFGGIAGGLARLAPDRYAPVLDWGAPDGEHPVGLIEAVIEAEGRSDPHFGGPRELPLRVWYPAAGVEGLPHRPLMNAREKANLIPPMSAAMPLSAFMLERLGQSLTWSYEGAPIATGPWPLLLFNPGFAGIAAQNSHLAEHLASHGYIVIAVDHPGGCAASSLPDGRGRAMPAALRQALLNPELLKAAIGLKRSKNFSERLVALRQHLAFGPLAEEGQVWVEDLRSVLDALSAGAMPPALDAVIAQADLGRIGVFGMSFGGAASATFVHQDERVSAAVNLDGGQVHEALLNTPIRAPLLMLHSQFATFTDGGGYNDFFYEPWAKCGQSGRVQRFVVRRSGHLDFTDMTVFGHGLVAKLLGLGGIEGARMLELTAALTRQFFEQHLRDGPSDWTARVERDWPEVYRQDCAPLREWAAEAESAR